MPNTIKVNNKPLNRGEHDRKQQVNDPVRNILKLIAFTALIALLAIVSVSDGAVSTGSTGVELSAPAD